MIAASVPPARPARSRFLGTTALLACTLLHAQQAQQPLTTGLPITTAPADPAITAALAQVSPDHIKATITKLISFNNRSTLSSMDTDLAPNTGVNAAADWIESEFKSISTACNNCLEVKRDTFTEPASTAPNSRITKPTKISNVYAVLRGTDPAQAARMVLVTGHYDSRNSKNENTHDPAPGANDDASGVAVSLESARILSKLKFPGTIVFVAVAGEEQGLNGSAHLAKLAREENWQLEAVLNNDIVGGDTTPGSTTPPNIQDKTTVRVFSEGVPANATPDQLRTIENLGAEGDSPSRELARAIVDVSSTYFHPTSQRLSAGTPANRPHSTAMHMIPAFHPVLIFRRDRFLRGGDHTSFNQEGFAAVRFTEWTENFNHQHQDVRTENGTQFGDLLQFVDFNYVANVARLNAATLATLASAPGEPQNVRILTTALDNNTELTWQPPTGAPANTTYEVVFRETDQPVWTDSETAGSSLNLKLAISKDNVVFAVRSVDPAGHRSIAVLPTPERGQRPPTPAK
ncbi:M20/M25/M40 family metallo-hydrolase [Tunturiibacter gelidoferens]|uniref:M20/M25/M40 family metallo-hydrolase n=1 Tax=Tunturiibacter gelidiferens TaxID=3069689 RepID=A0AAU7Z3B6_9BACT